MAEALHRARSAARARASARGLSGADAAALIAVLLLAGLYLWRLDGWLINDDEGSYLYAAWRIAGGELPYRDFLTPQLPAFLLPGAAVLRLGGDVWHLRALAAVLALGAGAATFWTARRLFGPRVAALAGSATLAHPLLFAETRTYRPDPFMLFLAAVGVALFARAAIPRRGADAPPSRAWLAVAGVAFGLALLAKLFALLPLCACLAWLATDGRWRGRPVRAVAGDVAAALLPVGLVVAAGLGAFVATSGTAVLDAVLGHHLRQGAGMGPVDVLRKGLGLAASFLRVDSNGLLLFAAAAAALAGWRARDRRALFVAWQLPTALAFFLMTRQLFPRHLLYLVPALATLFAVEVAWLARGTETGPRTRPDPRRALVLAAALAAGLLVPWLIDDWHQAWEWESGTRRIGDFLQLATEPSELVLADYSELNFYGRRATTYSAASLSEGAARSGQIAWSDPRAPHRLADELAGALPALVLVDTATEYSQLSALGDWGAFSSWLDENYGPPAGHLRRHHQVYLVYAPRAHSLPGRLQARFEDGPTLLRAGTVSEQAGPDEPVSIRTAWLVERAPERDLAVHCTLVDASGREWAQADAGLFASGTGSLRRRPSSEWDQGELLSDRLVLDVPPGTPPGRYDLTLALYDARTQDRLEAVVPGRTGSSQKLEVGSVDVRPTPGGRRALPAGALAVAAPSSDDAGLGIRLLGRGELARHDIEAGSTLDLDLWWSGRASDGELSARVTLSQPDSGAVAGDLTAALGIDGAGSSTWPDRPILVRQRLRLPVSAGAAGGQYELGVSLLRADGADAGRRQALGTVSVHGRDLGAVVTEAPQLDVSVDATFDGVAALLGLRGRLPTGLREASVAGRDPVTVELIWQALATVDRSYKVSLQLLDASGRVVAQDDAVPAAWSRPTTGWLPGEIIPDRHDMVVPGDLAPGSYVWLAALYDADSGTRLPVTGSDGFSDAARLGRLVISR